MAAAFLSSEILNEKRRRLQQLKLRATRQGYETPPEVLNEIADLEREITAAVAPASEAERYELLLSLVQEVRRDVRQLHWLIPVLMILLCAFLAFLVLVQHARPTYPAADVVHGQSRRAAAAVVVPASVPETMTARSAASPIAGPCAPRSTPAARHRAPLEAV